MNRKDSFTLSLCKGIFFIRESQLERIARLIVKESHARITKRENIQKLKSNQLTIHEITGKQREDILD